MPGYWTQLNSGRWRNGTFNKSVESEKFFFLQKIATTYYKMAILQDWCGFPV
ncbi:MAG: hypothetical protein KatS3mg027_2510 [Bacteroidia bacterium]|nr:MAG: hypothetical protein KatS3mg027_2510 [Bacteroidia bacterium]